MICDGGKGVLGVPIELCCGQLSGFICLFLFVCHSFSSCCFRMLYLFYGLSLGCNGLGLVFHSSH